MGRDCSENSCHFFGRFACNAIAHADDQVFYVSLTVNVQRGVTLILYGRYLKPDDKAFGIGMAYFVVRLLAFIPSPIIFGYAIDQTCLHWVKKPCGETSYCSVS